MTGSNRNKLVTPGSKEAIDRMKYEIANEFGVQFIMCYNYFKVWWREQNG